MEPILELTDIRKVYKDFTLGPLSVQLPRGYIMGLIGPNGAGKTTTMKLLMNLTRASGGSISIFGLRYPRDEKAVKNRIGYVPEVQNFYEDRTIAWTGSFVSKFYTSWDTNLFSRLCNRFDLSTDKKVRELSKGMRVKLSLVIALSHRPELILLDEPTSGLDPVVRREVLDILRETTAKDERRSVIISSHITEDIARIADSVMFLVDGRIHLSAEKDDLLADWKRLHYRQGVLTGDIAQSLLSAEENAFGCSGIVTNYTGIQEQLAHGIGRGDLKVESIGLDDILIALVHGR